MQVWADTGQQAKELAAVLPPLDAPLFKRLFFRVLEGGGWDAAASYAVGAYVKPVARGRLPWLFVVTPATCIRIAYYYSYYCH